MEPECCSHSVTVTLPLPPLHLLNTNLSDRAEDLQLEAQLHRQKDAQALAKLHNPPAELLVQIRLLETSQSPDK